MALQTERDLDDHARPRRRRGAPSGPAPDAHPRGGPAGAGRGRVRRHARPARLARVRQRRRRGLDGRRDRRLVRRDGPVQAPARPADPAHGADPQAQGRPGPRARGVRGGELPPGGHHPRAGRRRDGLAAGRPVAHRTRPTPAGWSTRAAELAAIALGKVTDEHVAGFVQDALVPRFREEPIAPLAGGLLDEVVRDDLHHGLVDLVVDEVGDVAGGEPRDLRRGARGAGAVVGAAAPQRGRHPAGAPPSSSTGWSTSATTRSTTPAQALDSMLAQLAHDLQYDPDTQARTEKLKDRLLDHPQVLDLERRPLERPAPRAPGLAGRPARRRPQPGCSRSCRRSPSGSSRTPTCAGGWTCWPPTRRCSSSTATAPS